MAIAYSLHKQRDAAMQEVAMIVQRLTDIEKKLEAENVGKQEDEKTKRTLVRTKRPGIPKKLSPACGLIRPLAFLMGNFNYLE